MSTPPSHYGPQPTPPGRHGPQSTPPVHHGPAPAPAHVTLVPVAVILACAGGGVALLLSIRDQLPDQMARHWDAAGRADEFSAFSEVVAIDVATTLAVPALLLALGLALRQARALGPIAGGMAAYLSVLLFGSDYVQRGLVSGASADIGVPLAASFGAGLAVGLILWWTLRRRTIPDADPAVPLPAGAPTLPAPATARIAWTGRTRLTRRTLVVIGLLLTPLLGTAIVSLANGATWIAASMGGTLLLLAVLLTTLAARVSVDASGVRARSLGLITWVTIPLSAIESATVTTVDPMGDFGGWGLRGGFDGSWGIVTSKGDALRLERAGDSPYYFTVSDAAGAAATVNTLIGRRRSVRAERTI